MKLLTLVRQGKAHRLNAPEGTYSYYHPERLFTGLGWDAQTASLLLASRVVDSILILGLGCGTVARQCRAIFPEAQIVGVELNPKVLELAYRKFALGSVGIEVEATAGQTYLRKTPKLFDAIVDDMWLPLAADAKPVLIEPDWAQLVQSRLSRDGMYAVNLYSRQESRYEARLAAKRLALVFCSLREVRPGPGETTVIAAGLNLTTPRQARARLRHLPKELAADLAHVSFHTI